MIPENLKYFLSTSLRLRTLPCYPVVNFETSEGSISIEELCEEAWLAQDKVEASLLLEMYADDINDYEYQLLSATIFGEEVLDCYSDELTLLNRIQLRLDQFLSLTIF